MTQRVSGDADADEVEDGGETRSEMPYGLHFEWRGGGRFEEKPFALIRARYLARVTALSLASRSAGTALHRILICKNAGAREIVETIDVPEVVS